MVDLGHCLANWFKTSAVETHGEGEELAVAAGAQGWIGWRRHRVGEDGVHLGQQAQDGAVVAGGPSQLQGHGDLGRCHANREGAGCRGRTKR